MLIDRGSEDGRDKTYPRHDQKSGVACANTAYATPVRTNSRMWLGKEAVATSFGESRSLVLGLFYVHA